MNTQSCEKKENTNGLKNSVSSTCFNEFLNSDNNMSKKEINPILSKDKCARHQVEFTKETLDIIDKKLTELDNNTNRHLQFDSFAPGTPVSTPIPVPVDGHEANDDR